MKTGIEIRVKPLFIFVAQNSRTFKMFQRFLQSMIGWKENLYAVVDSLDEAAKYLIGPDDVAPLGARKQIMVIAPIQTTEFFWLQKITASFLDINPNLIFWNYGKKRLIGYSNYIMMGNVQHFCSMVLHEVDKVYGISKMPVSFIADGRHEEIMLTA